MAAIDATPAPIYNQAYRIAVGFRDTSGNLITGWTSAAATAYPDNGNGVSLSIAESPANSGVGYVDIPAAQMACTMVTVKATISNSNATAFVKPINIYNYTEQVGAWSEQAQIKPENLLLDALAVLINQRTQTASQTTVTMRNGVTTKLAGVYTESSDSAVRGGLN